MTNKGEGCLTCRHVRFVVPSDWKPNYEGASFDVGDAAKIIRETKHHIKAECTLNPVWVPVLTNHYCGQWEEERGLYGRSPSIETFIWGTWQERSLDQVKKENQELKLQLKKSRDISASRLARLKKNGAASAEPEAT
jgi:hypothetical protein